MGDPSRKDDGFHFDRKDFLAVALVTAICVIILWPILSAGSDLAPGLPDHDGRTQWRPWRVYAAESLKNGILPLWNPYTLCGTPFMANFQSALFYPPNALFLVFPVGVAARLSILFHIWLSLLFTYLLARSLGFGRTAASIAAMTFGYCAAQVLRVPAGHWGVSCAIPWLVLILLCTELTMRRPGRIVLVIGACAVAFQVLSGVPQYVFITSLATGVFALLRGFGGGLSWRKRIHRWAAFAAMFALGAAVAAIQLIPGIEAAMNGARSLPMLPEWIEQFSLAPESLLTLIVPGFFGGGSGGPYWGRFLYWEMTAYVGVVALALAVFGLIAARPRRVAAWFGALCGLMLILAFGKHTPVMGILSRLLPLSGMFRGSSKFLLPFSLGLAMLAGAGAHALSVEWEKAGKRLVTVTLLFLVAAGGILLAATSGNGPLSAIQEAILSSGECLYSPAQAPEGAALSRPAVSGAITSLAMLACMLLCYFWVRRSKTGHGAKMFQAMLVALVAIDCFQFSRFFIGPEAMFKARGSAWPEGVGEFMRFEGGQHRLLALGRPEMNDGMIERVRTVEGIEPNPPVRFHLLFQAGQGLPADVAPSMYQLLHEGPVPDAMALGRILAQKDSPLKPPNAHVAWSDGGSNLWALHDVPPRVRVVHQNQLAKSPEEALRMTLAADLKDVVVLEESDRQDGGAPRESDSTVQILEDTANCVRVEATLDSPGWLVVSDNYFPGWTAEVDGKPARILRANSAFRAVPLNGGTHTIMFLYRPASLRLGLVISALALAACVAITLSLLHGPKKATAHSASDK